MKAVAGLIVVFLTLLIAGIAIEHMRLGWEGLRQTYFPNEPRVVQVHRSLNVENVAIPSPTRPSILWHTFYLLVYWLDWLIIILVLSSFLLLFAIAGTPVFIPRGG